MQASSDLSLLSLIGNASLPVQIVMLILLGASVLSWTYIFSKRAALRRAFARRDGPTLIEVPLGALPSPWEFIQMPPVRGSAAASPG